MTLLTSDKEKRRQAARKHSQRRATGELVRQRWERNGNKCEGCDQVVSVVEVAHIFGKGSRRSWLSEAWASTPELCAALCCARTWGDRIGCHEKLDRHLDARLEAQICEIAVNRLAGHLFGKGLRHNVGIGACRWRPTEAAAKLIREAEAAGIQP